MPALLCLVKMGKLRPRGAGPQDPRFLLPSIQYGGPGVSSPSCTVSFVLLSLQVGEGQPARSDGDAGPGPLRPQLGMGASGGGWGGAEGFWLPPLCLPVFRVVSPRDPLLALRLPSISGPQPPLTARLSG